MYSTNSAALTLATAASSSAAAHASLDSGRSPCTPDCGRRTNHRRGISRASDPRYSVGPDNPHPSPEPSSATVLACTH
jgi:hypothetical protein